LLGKKGYVVVVVVVVQVEEKIQDNCVHMLNKNSGKKV